jgi:hypothetical protein
VAAAVLLLALAAAAYRQVRLWEAVALAGLVVSTLDVARTGTWLLFVAAYPAVRALRLGVPERAVRMAAIVLGFAALALLVRQPHPGSAELAKLAAMRGQPVLAEGVLGHQVALAGGRVWVDNPLDAFRRADQRVYLDWLAGTPAGTAAISHARFVLVSAGSAAAEAAAKDPRLELVLASDGAALYRRSRQSRNVGLRRL